MIAILGIVAGGLALIVVLWGIWYYWVSLFSQFVDWRVADAIFSAGRELRRL
jgi:hypothetical protein